MEFTVRERSGRAWVSYECPCSCKPTAVVSQESGEPASEHCCCGRVHFAGPDAMGALQRYLADRRERGVDQDIVYQFGETAVTTAWDGALPVAYAIPEAELHREPAPAPAHHHDEGGPTMNEITLSAPDISCDHCINAIRKAVTELPQVEFVAGNPDAKQVTVRYNPEATPLTKIVAAMEEEGYPVKL